MPGTVGSILQNPEIPGFKATEFTDLGSFLTGLFEIAFFIATFLAFFWLVWGAFQYIYAGGNKENLAKARSRITWAIVGLLLTAVAYIVSQFTQQILQPKIGTPIL